MKSVELGEKTSPSFSLPTTHLTRAGLGLNPLLRGDRTVNKHQCHVTAFQSRWVVVNLQLFIGILRNSVTRQG
jgi:hypothetical protein